MTSFAIDTSAFVAIFRNEPGADFCRSALAKATSVILPGSCIVEAALLGRLGADFFPWFQKAISLPIFKCVEISLPIIDLAAEAVTRYGKGSGHPAQLNFGDCLVYAVAKYRDLPLLFIGDDFRHTDLTPALP